MQDETMLEQNKQIARRLYEECWNQGKVDRVDQLIAKDCRYHDPAFPSLAPGVDSLKRHITMCRNAFPDLRFSLDDMIAERDEVVVHWTANGTHEGPFLGVAATRKIATVGGTSIYRIKPKDRGTVRRLEPADAIGTTWRRGSSQGTGRFPLRI